MDLARAPRRAARKKGSGYENGGTVDRSNEFEFPQPRPQGLLRTWRVKNEKTLVKAVLNSVVIGLYI